jgi:hypothetical protein
MTQGIASARPQLSLEQLLADQDASPQSEDEFIARLHGEYLGKDIETPALSAITEVAVGVRLGLGLDATHSRSGLQIPIAQFCRERGRMRFLRKLLETGPPPAAAVAWPFDSPPAQDRYHWATFLASMHTLHVFMDTKQLRLQSTDGLHLIATSPLGEHSLEMLELALDFTFDANARKYDSKPQSGSAKYRPGTLHCTVLSKTINGPAELLTGPERTDMTPERRQAARAFEKTPHVVSASDVACCEFLMDRGALCSMSAESAMDAQLFVLTRRPDGDWADIRSVLELYVRRGVLNLDQVITSNDPLLSGRHPLSAAIALGNADAAEAFIDLGCSIDPMVVLEHADLIDDPDIVAYAHQARQAAAAAAVTAALMRRQVATAVRAPAVSNSPPVPRRRRMGV